jgi:hypothetical protein
MVAITSGTMKRRPRVVAAAGCHWNCHPDSSRGSDSLAIADGEHQPPAGDPLQHRLDLQLGPTGLEARWPARPGPRPWSYPPGARRRPWPPWPVWPGRAPVGWLTPASLPLPRAAAVSASVTVYRKAAASRAAFIVMAQPPPHGHRSADRDHRPSMRPPRRQSANSAVAAPPGSQGVGEAAPTGEKLSVVAGRHRARCEPQSGRDLPCWADPTVWHYKGAGQGGSVRLALADQCGRGLGWAVQRFSGSTTAAAGC